MTTYTYSARYLGWNHFWIGFNEESFRPDVAVQIIAHDSYFTYEFLDDQGFTIGRYVPIYTIVLEEMQFAPLELNIDVLDLHWGADQKSTVLLFYSATPDGEFDGEYVLQLDGDPLPDFSSLADLSAFIESFSAYDATGEWDEFQPLYFDSPLSLVSQSEDDIIKGSDDGDTLDGGLGEDEIYGLGGDDLLLGGDGEDHLTGGTGRDTLDGGADYDRASYSEAPDAIVADLRGGFAEDGYGDSDTLISIEDLRGSMYDDVIYGAPGANSLNGLAGNDTLDGRGGFDQARYDRDADYGGTAGVIVDLDTGMAIDGFGDTDTLIKIENVRGSDENDLIIGSTQQNRLRGYDGRDTLAGGAGDDQLEAGIGNDRMFGQGGSDVMVGEGGSDRMVGGGGNDTMIGGGGDDKLVGGLGDDEMTGNAGADIFIFKGNFGQDVITDFASGSDLIDLSKIALSGDAQTVLDTYVTDQATGAVIRDDAGNSILLEEVFKADLSVTDFLLPA